MLLLIIIFTAGAILMLCLTLLPLLQERLRAWQEKKTRKIAVQLDKLFYDKSPRETLRLYFILPPLLAFLGFLIFKSFLLMVLGALLGLFIPNFILKARDSRRRHKFNIQILDAIMILSSSLKGGLSLLQAFEILVEEMPQPMSQEIGLLVRENKMGVTLEDGLKHLKERMCNLDELDLLVNSLLVARETGGDLTKVLSRLSTTIRDNRKLKDNVRTLTLQGRLQGVIMSVLPFLFIWWVLTFNRQHFDIMLQDEKGRILLFTAVILQTVGMILIRRFSSIKI